MLKLIGSLLLLGGAAAIGFSAAAQLGVRVECLRAFIGAVEYMERELTFRLTPTPVLFQELTHVSHSPANTFFAGCAKKINNLGEKSMSQIWRETVEQSKLPLNDQELETVLGLGEIVGRYDGDGQREALLKARDQLDCFAKQAAEEQNRLGKVYRTLGLSAGAFLLLVLL